MWLISHRIKLLVSEAELSNALGALPGDTEVARTISELHRQYSAWLESRLAHRYGPQAAEDLVQETWLRVVPYVGSAEIRHPKALLLTIASNLARKMDARRAVSGAYASKAVQAHHEPAAQPTAVLGRQLLVGLPAPLRDVFVLSRIVGLTNAQIAEQLGISPKTVEGRMTKALAHCAAQLRR